LLLPPPFPFRSQGFHKILKKHDKALPFAPCQQFYTAHLHQQPWVQGNSSDILVKLSNVYSQLRGDQSGVKNEDASQGFVRSTTKYWVRMTDVSAVKHHILQHLPVFQFNKVRLPAWGPRQSSQGGYKGVRSEGHFGGDRLGVARELFLRQGPWKRKEKRCGADAFSGNLGKLRCGWGCGRAG
jgi:VTC domain